MNLDSGQGMGPLTDSLIEHLIFTKTPFPAPSNTDSGSSLKPDYSATSYLAHGWNHKSKKSLLLVKHFVCKDCWIYVWGMCEPDFAHTQWAQRSARPQLSSSKPLSSRAFEKKNIPSRYRYAHLRPILTTAAAPSCREFFGNNPWKTLQGELFSLGCPNRAH